MQFDVEGDIAKLRTRVDPITGQQLGPDRIRDAGGVPVSDRMAVLLEHMLRAHIMAAMGAAKDVEALACLRRFVEYVGALEFAVLGPFSHDADWKDDPRSALGLAAAALEGIVQDYASLPDIPGLAPEAVEQIMQGAQAFRDTAQRLRIIEERIAAVPGQSPGVVTLPTATIMLPGSAPGS